MERRIAIIGGTGLYKMRGLEILEKRHVDTPFGSPSDDLILGKINGKSVVFLPRHGMGHRYLPSEVNYRANIWALKSMGVEWIISLSAVGSFRKEIKPGDMVLVDQFYDRTYARESTFFGGGVVAHIMFAEPVCNALRKIIYDTGKRHLPDVHIHWGGTYLNMEGPAFSTKAESNIHRSMGIDVVGMTNATEAKLAREAEICYATVSLITDYDCWIEDDPEAMVSIEMIMENQRKNIENAGTLICEAVKNIPSERTCNCPDALKTAIISDKKGIPRETLEKLRPIIGKYVSTE